MAIGTLFGCAPATDEAAEAPEAVPAEISAGVGDAEGSEPKNEGIMPVDAAPASDEGIDTSIRDAGEFGDDALVAGLAPEGWTRTGNIEHYNVATMYTKINGRSELYMAYDVLGMSWVSFVDDTESSNFIDLFIYDMRGPTNAFGIYSVEREADQPAADLGREGYQTGSNFYFWKGNHYGYINASRENDANSKAGLGVATALMQRITDSGGIVNGLDWLPTDGLVNDTIQFFKADAMSLDFMNETFIAAYEMGDDKVRVFVSQRKDEAEAADIVTQFAGYGEDYGDGVENVTVAGVDVVLTDWGGDFYDAAFHIGPMVAGLSNVQGKDLATRAVENIIGQVKE